MFVAPQKEEFSGSFQIELVVWNREKPMRTRTPIVVASLAVMLIGLPLLAQEKSIRRSDLPPAVEKTVAAQSAGATVRGFSQEKEKGQIFYEAELTVNGHSKDVLMNANGEVVEVEEQVEMNALPSEVIGGLQARIGKGKLVKVESLSKHGKLVAYEAQVMTNGKRSEIQVGPDGKTLAHEE